MKTINDLKRRIRFAVSKKEKHCSVCDSKLIQFNRLNDYFWKILDEHQHIHSPFQYETLNWLEYSCPLCGAPDRDRLYALYFLTYRDSLPDTINLLDFAPSRALQAFLKKINGVSYKSADLYMDNVDDKVDIEKMTLYADNTFDFIICSHVLEHVVNDSAAIKEIKRVLKPSGKAILMAPISLGLQETLENATIKKVEDRWKFYGQDDHLRFYSKAGFRNLILDNGLNLTEYNSTDFGKEVFFKFGIHPRSVLYIAKK